MAPFEGRVQRGLWLPPFKQIKPRPLAYRFPRAAQAPALAVAAGYGEMLSADED
jgi:hypothetical protein